VSSSSELSFQNRLANESSPYLLQHANNPVDWHPWDSEALDLARLSDKPILVSIGYSACHWCHVMAHESFEDPVTAERMNELFVNIKVDREERPDLDKIYQAAHHLMARKSGGWPLTVFLNPHNLAPIFTGTYFPRLARYNLPPFIHVLERVAEYYRTEKDSVSDDSSALIAALNASEIPRGSIDLALLDSARDALHSNFDSEFGGFGGAPRFPHTPALEFLFRSWYRSGGADRESLDKALYALRKMAAGGLFDQIGGGFYRYSVDAAWQIPHFEKMLYDNGSLLGLYCWAWQISGEAEFHGVATATADWAIREMQSPEGGFYSSLDADSEGYEGRFYVWDRTEVASLIGEDEYRVVKPYYGLDETPNFESHWHLIKACTVAQVADQCGLIVEGCEDLLASAKSKLRQARDKRTRPGVDDKTLTAWNALMIKGLAIAGSVLKRADYLDAAERALRCVRDNAWLNGRLLATYKAGKARFPAYLDDYAFMLDACLTMLSARWSIDWLDWAQALAKVLADHFFDVDRGGFFFTADDHESLICRPKSMAEESMPSGGGVAISSLFRLGQLLGKSEYLDIAEKSLSSVVVGIFNYPLGYAASLLALDSWAQPTEVVVICGDVEAIQSWLEIANLHYNPRRLAVGVSNGVTGLAVEMQFKIIETGVAAFICQGTECLPPVTTFEDFAALMKEHAAEANVR
jgi:uncharacterized protein YyaL (SSP411 family)